MYDEKPRYNRKENILLYALGIVTFAINHCITQTLLWRVTHHIDLNIDCIYYTKLKKLTGHVIKIRSDTWAVTKSPTRHCNCRYVLMSVIQRRVTLKKAILLVNLTNKMAIFFIGYPIKWKLCDSINEFDTKRNRNVAHIWPKRAFETSETIFNEIVKGSLRKSFIHTVPMKCF